MRHFVFIAVLPGITLLAAAAQAQNYMTARDYTGPDIVVNMDVMGAPPAPAYSGSAPMLHPVAPPLPVPATLPPAEVIKPAPPVVTATDKPRAPVVMEKSTPVVAAKPPEPLLPVEKDEMMAGAADNVPMPTTAPPAAGRSLLAQAREQAEGDQATPRDAVILDDAKTASPLSPAMPPTIAAETAMLPAATKVDDFDAYRLVFAADSIELSAAEQAVLDKTIARLQTDHATQVQLRAYANGKPDSAGQARRISLMRALAVRTYLMKHGIPATRLDVRALGMGSADMNDQVGKTDIPPDRVDVIFVQPNAATTG